MKVKATLVYLLKDYYLLEELKMYLISLSGDLRTLPLILKMLSSIHILARACGVPVCRRSGGRLATTLVATKNDIIFFSFSPRFFSSVATFSHRRSDQIKKLILQKSTGAPKNLVGHFGAL